MLSTPSDKEIIAGWANAILAKRGLKPHQAARHSGLPSSTVHRLLGRDPKYQFTPSFRIVSQFAQAFQEDMPPIRLPDDEPGFAEPQVEEVKVEEIGAGEIGAGEIADRAPDGFPGLAGGQTVWRVRRDDLIPAGYLPGDFLILDQSGLELRDGDHVLVNIHDDRRGSAVTELRIVQNDWLLPATPAAEEMLYLRDWRVSVMGVVIRSWRERR